MCYKISAQDFNQMYRTEEMPAPVIGYEIAMRTVISSLDFCQSYRNDVEIVDEVQGPKLIDPRVNINGMA